MSKYLLLQTASPDGIIRLEHTDINDEKTNIEDIYFRIQCHQSIGDFLETNIKDHVSQLGLLMQVDNLLLHY